MSNKTTLRDFVRKTRNKKGLSLRQVRANSGHRLSAPTIQKIENGQTENPQVQTLWALSLGLDVDFELLCRIAAELPANPADYNGEEEELLRAFRRLNKRRKRELIASAHFWDSLDNPVDKSGAALQPVNNHISE